MRNTCGRQPHLHVTDQEEVSSTTWRRDAAPWPVIWLRKTRHLGGWTVKYPFLLEILWGGDPASRQQTFRNSCPGEFGSFSDTSLISCLRRGNEVIPPMCLVGMSLLVPQRGRHLWGQGTISFPSFRPFALILPSPCNASANQSHFHHIRGRAQIRGDQLMQRSCSQACMKKAPAWFWAAFRVWLMQTCFLPSPPRKPWFALSRRGGGRWRVPGLKWWGPNTNCANHTIKGGPVL